MTALVAAGYSAGDLVGGPSNPSLVGGDRTKVTPGQAWENTKNGNPFQGGA